VLGSQFVAIRQAAASAAVEADKLMLCSVWGRSDRLMRQG